MKLILLFTCTIVFSFNLAAQKICSNLAVKNDQNAKLFRSRISDDPTMTSKGYSPSFKPVSKSIKSAPGVIENLIGGTIYDLQTNVAVQNRIYVYPDGTIGTTWTMGYTPTAYADRGTGYNYYNGTSWGPEPTARIEPVRTGWPSYCPLGNGELIVAHDFVAGLQISKRPVKGTGAWTTTFLAAPAGATKVSWPRAITTGNTIHIIGCSGGIYQGLDLALLYYRSTDGGATWEPAKILPGLDAVSMGASATKSFSGFGGDSYAWAAPKGDTIAFALADGMGGAWIMKSFDNGVSWTKITVLSVPILNVAPTPIMASTDGSISMALDSQGSAHVVFGRMRVSDDDFSTAGNSYYPYTDGLIYWKEGMPVLDTTQLEDWDGLVANGNLIAAMLDYSGNDSIEFPEVPSGKFPFGLYGLGLSSMAQMVIDKNDNMFITYSSCREDLFNTDANPNAELYRHFYTISNAGCCSAWTSPIDLTDDIEHSYDECVFGSLAPSSDQSKLHIIYQLDAEPGTSLGGDADQASDNFLNYLNFPTFVKTKPLDIAKYVSVSPNPAHAFVNVVVSLHANEKVELAVYDVLGKQVLNYNYGEQFSGYHTYEVNVSDLPAGIYLFNIKIGNSQASKKVIVK